MSKELTTRTEDYSQWYNDLVIKGGLADYSAVRGCMVIKPHGYALWENMRDQLDRMFKETGHENAYFPLFVPKSLFEAEEKNAETDADYLFIESHTAFGNRVLHLQPGHGHIDAVQIGEDIKEEKIGNQIQRYAASRPLFDAGGRPEPK